MLHFDPSMTPSSNKPIELLVDSIRAEARDIMSFTLVAPDGGKLPSSGPGGHVEIALPNGLIRHYSMVNDCSDTDHYLISVGRTADSSGGSDFLHTGVRVGDKLQVTAVRNNFELDPHAKSYRFIAGGIGITPIMSMIRWCRQNDRPWKLIYAARSRQRAAYYEELAAVGHEFLRVHLDDEAGEVLDVTKALQDLDPDEQVYCCGPAPLMTAVANATDGRPVGSVYFEWFNAGSLDPGHSGSNSDMTVELRRSKLTLQVPGHQSILEAIEAAGIDHPFSCREGACATCETRVLEGAIDHRDFVLSEEQRRKGDAMMICVSRAADGHLVLDL